MNDGGREIAGPEGQSPLVVGVGTHVCGAGQARPDPFRVPHLSYEPPLIADRGSLVDLTRTGFDPLLGSRGVSPGA